MFLKDQQDPRKIIAMIIEGGKEKFLETLCIGRVSHSNDSVRCPICQKSLRKKAWMLTDAKGVPVVNDRFDTDDCADKAIQWLRSIFEEYKGYLGSRGGTELTEDDLRDPLFLKDEESLKKFRRRCQKHVEHLEELTPEINYEVDYIEDHQ